MMPIDANRAASTATRPSARSEYLPSEKNLSKFGMLLGPNCFWYTSHLPWSRELDRIESPASGHPSLLLEAF